MQQGKNAASKQAATAKRQAKAAKAQVQTSRHEAEELKALLENVLVSPPAFASFCLAVAPTQA